VEEVPQELRVLQVIQVHKVLLVEEVPQELRVLQVIQELKVI
jgi:hypothetical protein